MNKDFLDKYIKEYTQQQIEIRPESGGYVKTQKVGFTDAYFFLTKRKFFDIYNVDWYYGDTNHGATMFCMYNDLKFLHLGPYYDNPNYDYKSFLVVIDEYSSKQDHWSNIEHQRLGKYGIYHLWRIKQNGTTHRQIKKSLRMLWMK